MFTDKAIGERIREELKHQGMSQADLSGRIFTSKQNISNYLAGRHIPDGNLAAIAKELGCSEAYLLGLTDAHDPWTAVAVDELGLSENAVDVLMGRSPQKHRRIDNYLENGELEPHEAGLSSLEAREENIHRVVSALLDTPAFEDLLLAIENGLAHETGELRARAIQKTVNTMLDDTPYIDADGKTYRVGGERYAEYLKMTVLSAMQKTYEALLEDADKILPAMGDAKEQIKEVDHDGE